MERIEDYIEECIELFGGQVVEVRYTEERKKRLINYLAWNKETVGGARGYPKNKENRGIDFER